MEDRENLLHQAKDMLKIDRDLERVVQLFHDAGVGKREAKNMLSLCAGISNKEARRFVHNSRAFHAYKADDEALHNAVVVPVAELTALPVADRESCATEPAL